ncbi:hypothetical protein [Acuticoccus kandeliae]|uniref:hypothetical protein n=1 Tax=Acuticoccus kandeliae TaxID=2073160 RepID=UPI00130029AE|nr:hypothetical protein [Acuticoccus kandeliae]
MNLRIGLTSLIIAVSVGLTAASPVVAQTQPAERIAYLRAIFGGGLEAGADPVAVAVIGARGVPLACRRLVRRPAFCDEISPSRRPIIAVAIAILRAFWGGS